MSLHRVFVFGTLKEGYSNFHINRGKRVGGDFITVERYPLYILGDQEYLPWLVPLAGQGHRVVGQVFEVDDATLVDMDKLERVDEPLWYRRMEITVQPREGGPESRVWVYFGNVERMRTETVHIGPVPEYTQELAAAYPLAGTPASRL